MASKGMEVHNLEGFSHLNLLLELLSVMNWKSGRFIRVPPQPPPSGMTLDKSFPPVALIPLP